MYEQIDLFNVTNYTKPSKSSHPDDVDLDGEEDIQFNEGDLVRAKPHGDRVFEIKRFTTFGWADIVSIDGELKTISPLKQLSYVTPESIDTSSIEPKALHKTDTGETERTELSYVTPENIDTPSIEPKTLHKTKLELIKDDCHQLTQPELIHLRDWLTQLIENEEDFTVPKRSNREVVEVRRVGAVVYQLEKTKCGNPRCKSCPHGPYWYSYQRVGGRVKSKYVGKNM